MERMLVVVFDNEKRAYEGESALKQLENEGLLTVYERAVIVKHAEGTVSLKQVQPDGPVGSLAGTAVGGLIGLLGGPVGAAIGAASGLALGVLYDVDNARVGSIAFRRRWTGRSGRPGTSATRSKPARGR